ncbi:MAG: hypothetical protein CSA20_04240 [Deltaproteobacteria bacterium]|nr:MAG: hypothetical protein CSA20_04240 [Deltaproteobacteria bacterium]
MLVNSSYLKSFSYTKKLSSINWLVVVLLGTLLIGSLLSACFYTKNLIVFFACSILPLIIVLFELLVLYQFLKRNNYVIRINKQYLIYLYKSQKVSILWDDIHSISDSTFFSRVTLKDKNKKKIIHINYDTSYFEELLTAITQHAQFLTKDPLQKNFYYKQKWTISSGLVFIVFCYFLTYITVRVEFYLPGIILFFFSSYLLYIFLKSPKKLTIKDNCIVLSNYFYVDKIYFSNIAIISVAKQALSSSYSLHVMDRNRVYLRIYTKRGKEIKLDRFNIDVFSLSNILNTFLKKYEKKL